MRNNIFRLSDEALCTLIALANAAAVFPIPVGAEAINDPLITKPRFHPQSYPIERFSYLNERSTWPRESTPFAVMDSYLPIGRPRSYCEIQTKYQRSERIKLGVPRPNWAGRCVLSFNFHDSLNRDVCFVLKGLVALVEVHQRAEYPTALDSFALFLIPLNPTVRIARVEVCAEGRLCRPPAEFECIPFSPTSLTSLFSRIVKSST